MRKKHDPRASKRKNPSSAQNWIRRAVKRIAAKTRPERIILFGSRAEGTPRKDSDFDLLIILRQPRSRERSYQLVDDAIGDHLWPLDLLVRRPEEVQSRIHMGDPFFSNILKTGKVLYES